MSEEFVPLGYLLIEPRAPQGRPWGPGTLATAIERSGIYGWDRFMRFRKFAPNSPEAAQALDALARQAQHDPDDRENQPPVERDDGTGSFYSFGWPRDKLPEFAAIEGEDADAPAPPRRGSLRTENATLAIVGGLLAFIFGELGNKRHPDFRSENQLIEFLEEKCKGYGGLSKRNLQDKFAAAKALMDMNNE